jgi:hypothetical protein
MPVILKNEWKSGWKSLLMGAFRGWNGAHLHHFI